jgi:hypothetical protein
MNIDFHCCFTLHALRGEKGVGGEIQTQTQGYFNIILL